MARFEPQVSRTCNVSKFEHDERLSSASIVQVEMGSIEEIVVWETSSLTNETQISSCPKMAGLRWRHFGTSRRR